MCAIPLQQICAIKRHDRNGDEIGSKKRDDDAKGQRREKKLAHAIKQSHGKEHDHRDDGYREHRQPNFVGALFGGYRGILAELDVTENVFENDHGIVDQARKRERQAAQDHAVDRRAADVKDEETRPSPRAGIERNTATVARGLPRKTKTISAVSTNPIPPSCNTVEMACFTNSD